jgi:hypothetical protein
MSRYTYLYENIMFTNKKRHIIWGGKGKDWLALIKSLIYPRVGRGALRGVL